MLISATWIACRDSIWGHKQCFLRATVFQIWCCIFSLSLFQVAFTGEQPTCMKVNTAWPSLVPTSGCSIFQEFLTWLCNAPSLEEVEMAFQKTWTWACISQLWVAFANPDKSQQQDRAVPSGQRGTNIARKAGGNTSNEYEIVVLIRHL